MIAEITRYTFVVAGAIVGYKTTGLFDWTETTGFSQNLVIFLFVLLGASIGYVFGGIIGREFAIIWSRIEDKIRLTAPSDLLLGTAGLIAGLIVALLISVPLRFVPASWLAIVMSAMLLGIGAYAGVRIALVKRRDFVHLLAGAFPGLLNDENGGAPNGDVLRPLLLDTSAIIDARFAELVRLGYLRGHLRVPRFVLAELQTLADSADDMKRARGRRGLDLLDTLSAKDLKVETFEADFPEFPAVDDKLIRLATQVRGTLVTVDFNLTKVARLEGVEVLNMNELAASLRPTFLPGEVLSIRIAREGREPEQGVGYLEDGTMVVVQQGRNLIGQEVDTEVTSVLQTSAGRMIFARVRNGSNGESR